jgi:hypothetical protein
MATTTAFDAFAGNAGLPLVSAAENYLFFAGVPNDGVVAVSSALPNGGSAPILNLHGPYPLDHLDIVNNSTTVPDVLAALNGQVSSSENYTLSTNPSTFSVTAGGGSNFQLTATSTGGFRGTVTISPFGSGGINGSCSPANISVTSSTPVTTNCSFTTSSSMSAGPYPITVESVSVPLNPITASITVNVSAPSGQPGYTVIMGGSGQSVTAGNSAQFSLTTSSVNGFSGTVSLEPASMSISGATSSWSSPSILITPSTPGTSTLTVYTSTSTPAGTYSITEYMPNGQSSSVTLTVTAGSGGGNQPPTATTESASASTNSATLYGTVNPNGSDTHYYFLYGTTSSSLNNETATYDLGAGTGASGISANIASLTAGTLYYFRIVAYNSHGTTMGSIVPFNTTSAAAPLSITSTTFNPSTATVGAGYQAQQAMAATGGTQPYSWTIANQPSGMAMNASSGALYGTPTSSGSFNITVTVLDSSSPQKTASKVLPLTVVYATPTISYITPSSFTKGQGGGSMSAVITGTGFTGQSYHQYSVSGGAQWAWAQQSPWDITSTSMTIDVNTGTAETQLWRVCAAQVSSPVCSNSVTVTVK